MRPDGPTLRCGRRVLPLHRPQVMGVINVTSDSFSDGARFLRADGVDLDAVEAAAVAMVEAGATVLDVGGESTRPGAAPVAVDDELARVIPVVRRLSALDAVISVDTSKPAVAAAAIAAGATMINDVRALQEPGMLALVAASDVAICVMHMQGAPRDMQDNPQYDDVVDDVLQFLECRVAAARAAGVAADRIVVDPGFGFGKTLAHNLQLLRSLRRVTTLGYPVLAGLSRKRMIGTLTGKPVTDRVAGSVAAAIVAVQHGAAIVRVHDVGATVDALAVVMAVAESDND